MDRQSQPVQRGRPVSGLEAAHANEYFEQFLNASSLKHILGYYRGLIDYLHLKPNEFLSFYPKLRANLTSWKAKALWKKFDARAAHKCYMKGKAAANTRVLIIGGGPCGMRTAIEAQLLGAKVVVIEKRDRFSRNNVLHLWPFVIEDLRMLGAKKFFGKFCAGAIDHISIRRLQCILLKVALLLGVEVHTEVSFEKLIEPNANEKTGWRAEIKPTDHPVSQYEFDVIIGADGKRNTLQGFTRKEFRGKLAIAITANFINKKTEAEARVEEISGVAFIFNQKFFKDLQEATRIDLENIVYYKDDTHYFVMTAKKASLIEKGVIKQDLADTEKLLAPENVDRAALEAYAIEAANFSTNYQMPDLEFAVNHYGQPDIAMFDFTSMFAADNASKVVERNGYRLLMILVGDSLLEPFWPTGSGCARGFLSSLDAAWAIRSWSLGTLTPLDVLAERESIYRLLAQTTPDNLNKDWKSYTLEPSTRYPNLNKAVIVAHQMVSLYDTDNPASIERMKRNAQERPTEVPKKRRRGNVDNEVLLNWISEQLRGHEDITLTDIGSIFKNGKVLCAIIHHYRPDLLDYSAIKDEDPTKNNQTAFDVLEKELGIPPIMTGEESINTEDYLTMATYLTQVYDTFRGEIPHIKHPKLKLRSKIPKSLTLSKIKSSATSTKPAKKKISHCKCHKDDGRVAGADSNTHELSNDSSTMNKSQKSRTLKLAKGKTSSGPLRTVIDKKSSTASENGKKLCVIKRKSSELNKKTSHSRRTNEKLKLNVATKSTQVRKVDAPSYPLIRTSSTKTKLGNVQKEILPKENSVINLLKYEKVKSRTRMRNKKMGVKKSKLSVIPEIKIEVMKEGTSSTTVRFPSTTDCPITNQLEDGAGNKYYCVKEVKTNPKERVVHKKVECQTIYNRYTRLKNSVNFSVQESIVKKESLPKVECGSNSDTTIKIRYFEKSKRNCVSYQEIEYVSSLNLLTISSKTRLQNKHTASVARVRSSKKPVSPPNNFLVSPKEKCRYLSDSWVAQVEKGGGCRERLSNYKCRMQINSHCKHKFPSNNKKMTMSEGDGLPDQIYSRVSNWISSHDFQVRDPGKDNEVETVISNDMPSDITSVTRNMVKRKGEYDDIIIEERTDVVKCRECESPKSSERNFSEMVKNMTNNKSVRTLSKFSQYSPFNNPANLKSASAPPTQFSVIVEGEESELPESNKRSELSFKTIKTSNFQPVVQSQPSRPSSRHKRHADAMVPNKPPSIDRRMRKRRTLEKIGASVMFSLFLNAFMETGIVAIVLFVLDIIINSEQYGYQNYIFSSY
ncbi:hypothetical protein NQ315_006323 [Exocentrus adspersus]|uniref:F-actin monooxygenase n=1 Tax=Exocentrus adspersus TaxID=1586481 RepID=A0AAV8VZM6_9CUCU|nr:hypothetical protein NQ315_006323 [Exocentrus adspersus]